MKIFNYILSRIFRIILIFMLVFMWVRFYENNLMVCLSITSILTIGIDLLFTFFIQKKENKVNLKKAEIEKAEGFCNYFIFNNQSVAIDFFNELLSLNYKTEKKNDFIIFENEKTKAIFYPYFTFDKVTVNNLVEIFNSTKNVPSDKIIVCCNNFDNQTLIFANSLPCKFILIDKYNVYEKIMKKYNFFPKENLIIKSPKKNNFKTLLEYALNKKRAKGYIFASFILILSSFFVKVSVYYLIISSILLLLALFSYTNKTYNKNISDNIV